MSFAVTRRVLFQVHMWVGLVLGLLLALLGLSGSILVYDDAIAELLAPAPRAAATGTPLSLDRMADAARGVAGRGALLITLPRETGEAVSVRVTQARPRDGGARPAEGPRAPATQVFIDPVSGAVLGTRKAQLPPLLMFAHQLHGNFLIGGREGRQFVGWLGLAMLVLGATGLVLWWPKRGQWKYAFFVRRTAKGLRFHRELHAATGIWIFLVFMAVSFSGVAIAFPESVGMVTGGAPAPLPFNLREGPAVTPLAGAAAIGPAAAVSLAQQALPNALPTGIALPARRDQAVIVSMLTYGAIGASVYVDPWRARVMAVRDPSANFIAWQRPLHQGMGFGAIWRALVFLSGLVPALFVVTGVTMWVKKRRQRISMSAVLAEEGST